MGLAVAASLVAAVPARAGALFFAGTLKDGRFHPDKTVKGPCYTVRYSTIAATIDGASAETTVQETVIGPKGPAVKTLCLIPLPETVDRKSVKVTAAAGKGDPRELAGKFLLASDAQAVYEAIAKGTGTVTVVSLAGRPAVLIEDFALPAKAEITISFTQRVSSQSGVQVYECPMPATAWARGPVARLSLTATVTAGKALRAIFSPSHAATVERDGLRKAQGLVKADHFAGRDDFRLSTVADDDDLGLRLLAHRPDEKEDGYFLLVGNPTGSVAKRDVLKKDVLFVLDTSGSMRGEKIEQAQAAIEYCLGRLNDGDRFNIITFGTKVTSFRDAPVANDKAGLGAAREFIDAVVARGRTNISGALARGLAGTPPPGRPRIMIFLTDGTPTAGEVVPEKIVEKVPALNTSGTRIFVMGLGHDVNAHLLDKLAEATEGSCEYVDPDQDIDVKIAALYDRLSNPVLNHAVVTFGGLRPTAVFPKKLPALFAGTEIMVAGRYRKGGPRTVTISGTLAGKPVRYVCKALLPDKTAAQANEFVAPMWAARKIGFLLREIRLNGESKELIAEIVRLSTKFGIITEYTDFLATAGGGSGPGAGKKAKDIVLGRLRQARAQQSGRWAFNQAVNEQKLQNRVVVTDAANLYRDRRGEMVASGNIRQIGRQVFYLRDGQWVEADAVGKGKARRVKLFSKEYFDLLRTHKDFARAQRLGWNVEMKVGAERIAVEKDGKIKDESQRAPALEQKSVPQLRGKDQQLRNQLQQIREKQLRRRPNAQKNVEPKNENK